MPATVRLPFAALALALAVPVGASAAPAPAGGAAPPLPFPAKAPVVVQVNGLERAKGRLLKMLDALPPAEAKQAKQQIDAGLTKLLTGRKLTAVPADGRVFLVVHDFARITEDEPAISVLVPATGYKEFKESFLTADERKTVEKAGKVESVKLSDGDHEAGTFYLADAKGYVAVSPSQETAELYLGKYATYQAEAMGPDLSASFLAADVAVFVNLEAINAKYGEQIQSGKGLIDFFLGQAEQGGMIPGLNKQQIAAAKVFLHGLVQAVEDAQALVIAAEFRPEGLDVRGQVRFGDDTASAKLLKPETPGPLAEVAKLPAGLTTYSGSKFGKAFADLSKKLASEFAAADDDAKGAARIEKLMADLAAAGPEGEVAANNAPETTLTVSRFKDPAKAAAALSGLYQGAGAGARFMGVVLKEKPKVTEQAQTHRGFALTEVKLAFDFDATVEALPEAAREATLAQFKRLLKEKTTFWVGTDGKVVVNVTAKDWAAAQKLLDAYLDGKATVGSDAQFQLARKNLPADATLVYLVETQQALAALVEQVKTAGDAIPGGGLPPIGAVKPVKGDPTYFGVAVVLKPRTAGFDLFVPGTAMNVGAKVLSQVFKNVE